MSKLQKIESEIAKTKQRIDVLQNKLKELEQKKTECINLEIVNIVRSENMTPEELKKFIQSQKKNNTTFNYYNKNEDEREDL